jgi:hypothetical protein
MLVWCSTGQGYGVGSSSVFDLIGNVSGGGLFTTENRVDLANEINEPINGLQIVSPTSPWSDVQNVLIAADCRIVAASPGSPPRKNAAACASSTASWNDQIAANTMPAGTLIVANVPDVYRELRRQAVSSNQTTAQLVTTILTRAAGK